MMNEICKMLKTEKTAREALDQAVYKGRTIREWVDGITRGDFEEIRHGRWKAGVTCSRCGFIRQETRSGNPMVGKYCPNCGAKMDGEKNNGKTTAK